MSVEMAIKITTKLYAARDAVQRIYGAKALEMLTPYMDLLQAIQKKSGLPLLPLAQRIAEDMVKQDLSPLMVLAAMVELLEPSPKLEGVKP